MSNNETAIQVQDLTKRFGKLIAVDRISFEVRKGEIFGFLGPNGAGKTTTVRMLTGILNADAGEASIFGYKAGSLAAKQVAGVVPETANAYVDLSAWDNLMLMSNLYGMPTLKARERGESLLRQLGLYDRRDDAVKGFSKGMKQRLILCMALVSGPQILFLDEPTSGLDVQSARSIKELLVGLNKTGQTIFLTTHDMEEANQLCDRVAIISKGKIVAIDSPEKLRAAIIGSNSVEVSLSPGVSEEALTKLSGVTAVRKVGDKFRLYTQDPGSLVTNLVNYAGSAGQKIVSLNTLKPSLEDAFVSLVGKGEK